MANDFWFKFEFKEWANDTKPLSLMARGLLLELIIYMRRPECAGRMPNDVSLISRLTGGLTEQVTECLTEIKKFAILNFEKNDTGHEEIVSRRIIREFKISEINRLNGSLGGNPDLKNKKPDNNSVNPPVGDSVKRKANRTSYSYSNSGSNFNSSSGKGGTGGKTKIDLVFPFESKKFKTTWSAWLQYREEIKKPYRSQISQQATLKQLSKFSEAEAIAMIEQSIASGWQGIFEIKNNGKRQTESPESKLQRLATGGIGNPG